MKKFGIFVSLVMLAILTVAVIAIPHIDITEISGIKTDSDYIEFEKLKGNGLLNENNEHIINSADPDKIRVSFANNQALTVGYFFDKEMTQQICGTAYLNPGDIIYIKLIETLGDNKDLYKFSKYEVYEISEEITRERFVTLDDAETFFAIPENFKGKELQIVPFGEYKKELISLNAFCSRYSKFEDTVDSIEWTKNNVALNGKFLELEPSETYTLRCKYDANEYFFMNSTPECFSNSDGLVEFKTENSSGTDRPEFYEVELIRYIKLNFEFDKKAEIYYNDALLDNNLKKFDFTTSHKLKFGDKITIKTAGSIKITDGDYNYISVNRDYSKVDENYIYQITIDYENIKYNISDNICDGVDVVEDVTIILPTENLYGKFAYEVNSVEVNGKCTLKEGDKLKVTYTITDENYIFADQNTIEKLFNSKSKNYDMEITTDKNGKKLDFSAIFKVEKRDSNE